MNTAINLNNNTNIKSVSNHGKSRVWREINTVWAIFMREVTLAFKSPGSLIFTLVMPIVMMGMVGGNLMQNMAGGLEFQYGEFMLVGMLINMLFMGTANGVASLVDDNDSNFSEEMLIAPVSRYAIVTGKICGAMFTAIVSMIGTLVVGAFMGITLTFAQLLLILALSPLMCLSAGAFVMIFIGLIKNKKTAIMIIMVIAMSQMFLSGGIIPINNSSGILYVLSRIMPMTYCLDLARAVIYAGTPEYAGVVLFNPAINLAAIITLSAVCLICGTIFYARSEKNK